MAKKPFKIQFSAKWIKSDLNHEFNRGDLLFKISKAGKLWKVSVENHNGKMAEEVTSFEIAGKLSDVKTQCENFES